jgi:hypothetical protein
MDDKEVSERRGHVALAIATMANYCFRTTLGDASA